MEPVMPVDIVNVIDSTEALALRSALEWRDVRVTLHLIGQALDLVRVLGTEGDTSDTVLLVCRGDERGLIGPELAASVEDRQPYHGRLGPGDLGGFLDLPDRIVVKTGCRLGTPDFAEAFLAAGCRAYVDPDNCSHGDPSPDFVGHFFYTWPHGKRDIIQACEWASSRDEDTRMFKLCERGQRCRPCH